MIKNSRMITHNAQFNRTMSANINALFRDPVQLYWTVDGN